MAEAAELKHMIMSFRVSELQVLLGFAGRNKSGRKQELLQRALQLVQKGCGLQVQIKIRELYRQIFASNAHRRRFNETTTISPGQPDPQAPTPGIASGYSQRSSRSSTATSVNSNHISMPSNRSRPIAVAPNNNRMAPSQMSRNNNKGIDYGGKHLASLHQPPSTMPVHPDVRFKHLPFYDLLAELMKPTSLVPKSNNRFQESFFVFHLTPQQAQDIAMSRDFRPGAKCEYTVQVQLRFCLLETSCEQADNFPPSICVRVNGKMAPLPNPIPTTKPGIEPKRPGRAIDITSLCRLSPTISNHLDVSWASEFGRGYCLAVFLVRRLTSDILLQRLKQFGNRHPDHTRALIKEKLVQDPDSEIATTSLRVSLMCPLGKMRLQIPCRASTCTHLQCYDANTFLMMNEKKSTWICPVCDKAASFDKLIIDGYFLEIFRASPECSEIQFHPDGNWSPLEQPKETHVISSPVVKVTTKPEPASTSTIEVKNEPDVIDLTLDSSDEEEVEEEVVAPKSVSDKGPQSFDTRACPIIINDSNNALDLSPSGSLGISPYPVNFQDITCTLPQFDRMQENYTVPNGRSGMENISPPNNYSTTVTGMFSNQVFPEDLRIIPPPQKSPVQNINPSKAWNLPEPPPLIPIETRSTDYITPTLPNSISLPNFLDDPEFFSIMNNENGQMVMLN